MKNGMVGVLDGARGGLYLQRLVLLSGLMFSTLWPGPGNAQDDSARSYPTKTVRLVVGSTPGSGNDILARLLAADLTGSFGRPVIVENRPGAHAIVAAEYVAKSAPDGYTVFMAPSGPMLGNPAVFSKLPYSPVRDFAPVTLVASVPLLLVVSGSLPVRSVGELVDFAKARPNQVNYAASTSLFQLAAELFNQRTGTKFTYIPYKGGAESASSVASGVVTMTLVDPPPLIGLLQSGKVRALAISSPKRHPSWPDVPTFTESNLPDMDISIWFGLFVPAGTSHGTVTRLHNEAGRFVNRPDIRKRMNEMGMDPSSATPEELGRIVAAGIAKWTTVAKAANVKSD